MQDQSSQTQNVQTEVRHYGKKQPEIYTPLPFTLWFPGVFINPKTLFRALSKRTPRTSDWLYPALGMVALSLIMFVLSQTSEPFIAILNKIGDDPSSADGIFRSFERILKYDSNPLAAIAFALLLPVTAIVGMLVNGAVVWVAGKIFTRMNPNYRQCLTISGAAYVVSVTGSSLQLLFSVLSGSLVSFRLVDILQLDGLGWISVIFAMIEPFHLYYYAVVIIGLYVFSRPRAEDPTATLQ